MHLVIAHNAVTGTDGPDCRDVLDQVDCVHGALARLEHTATIVPCTLDLAAAWQRIETERPGAVFNLVESLAGRDRLMPVFPFMLDAMGLPYTGAPSAGLLATTAKTVAKKRLLAAGLPTASWVEDDPLNKRPGPLFENAGPVDWIIKSVWEHASVGLDEGALLQTNDRTALLAAISERAPALGGECFAERFIEGREFNIALLDGPHGPEVLPPAEIRFEGYAQGRLRIVDYKAKWDESSFEYRHTTRSFDFGANDAQLLAVLANNALKCWRLFGLSGYARVDFRVDLNGNPWILEINANPCLSPDAGFAAALARAAITIDEAVRRILLAALSRRKGPTLEPDRRTAAISYRYEANPDDPARVRTLVESTGFFNSAEVGIAEELVSERLARGDASGYHFVFATQQDRLIGYACYGLIPCTVASYDLYWIAVHPDCQGKGVGRQLLQEAEQRIRATGGTRIYADTSQRAQYASTRAFYEKSGFRPESLLTDFYAPGDGKVVYCKVI